MATTFMPGNVVTARGRQWIVLPESEDDLLMVRPMGGLDDEVVGICTALEEVRSANFSLPDAEKPGDYSSCRLLRDAARLSTRAAAGPFRSFGKVGVEPRPYQLVPLLMALRQETIRLLIADDVGIGKTVEAALIAKELVERGEVTRLAVLCPPHLAEQWQRELEQKFHISAELVLSSTVKRLERGLRAGESLFERHPFVIISTDYIKSVRHRDDFLRSCPELVIVDEAHTCTLAGGVGRSRQARFELLQRIAADKARHLILVTATPHSGNEDAFRSLLSLLDDKFAHLPTDMEADSRSAIRAELARHLVQRLRGNVIEQDRALDTTTTFPDREDAEESYKLSPAYKAVFRKALDFVNEMVQDESGNGRTRRVRWWSALALLRAMASSPAAAAAPLRKRAETATASPTDDETDADAVDEIGRQTILDEGEDESVEFFDGAPGADVYDDEQVASARLRTLAREAEKLAGDDDLKLQKLITLAKKLIKDGYQPIVFCRFIDTADYVAAQLRAAIKGVEVASITGTLPPKEREDRIKELAEHPKRILVCTDCLSEGVNLQTWFNAVIHYDLSWNPTRHDQREGRVDRFGQASPKVRVLTIFGVDNKIDGVVLDVLLRKHKSIKSDLGVAVAVPGGSEDVIKALFAGMELRGDADAAQLILPGMDDRKEKLHAEWENAREKEKKSRARFAQLSIKTEEVAAELESVRRAIGAGPTVERFLRDVLHLAGVPATDKSGGVLHVPLDNSVSRSLRHALGREKPFSGRFDLPVAPSVEYLSRTHPIVEGLASWVLDTALDDVQAAGERTIARRCGVAATGAVAEATTLLLARFRHHLHVVHRDGGDAPLLAEEVISLGFTGTPAAPKWLAEETVRGLLDAPPTANLPDSLVKQQLRLLLKHEAPLRAAVDRFAHERATELAEAHRRVRKSAKIQGSVAAEPVFPVDFLGCFILIPQDV